MKKIKLVISDLHLGRGRFLQGGSNNLLEEFYYDEQFAEFLNYYTTGEFQDSEVELIMNGDCLNFLQVDYMGHHVTALTEGICLSILKTIVEGHVRFFEALRKFLKDPRHSLTYVVGNHDQAMLWPSCRAFLNQSVGGEIHYKNLVYFFDGIHIEHGHMHEAANRLNPRRFFLKKDLPEPILNLPFGSHFFIEFVLKLKELRPYVDKVRPFHSFFRWGLVQDTLFTLRTLFGLMAYFIGKVLQPDPRRQWSAKQLLAIVKESAIFPDLGVAARRILMDERVSMVIFGHNHVYQYRQFAENKEYFNTGTWTELTSLDITSLGKITKLTYVLLEYDGEINRPRGRLKEWRGFHRIERDVDL